MVVGLMEMVELNGRDLQVSELWQLQQQQSKKREKRTEIEQQIAFEKETH